MPQYGLGLSTALSSAGIYGHNGGFLGYLVQIHHAPTSGVTVFLSATDSRIYAPPGPYSRIESIRGLEMRDALRSLISS